MSKDIGDFVKNNMSFLSIQDGETVKLIYKGYSIVPDRFKPGKETVSYLFQWPDNEKTISWNKSSNKVAMQMMKINPGEMVEITRSGEGMGTVYKIKHNGIPF